MSENRVVYKNVPKYGTAEQDTSDNTIRCMLLAYWISKVTDTHSEYVTHIAFARHGWLRERAPM